MKVIKKKERNSSIELLRILSMFAIVIHHYAVHGTLNPNYFNATIINTLRINLFLHYFGKIGVSCFVMIGAYFLCEKSFKFRRPVNLIITMIVYSFGIYLVLKYIFRTGIWGPDTLTRILLPFPLPSGYWFVYAYIVMLFAMPFLNIIINILSKKKLLLLIIGLTILWSLLPTGIWMFNTKPDTSVDDFGYTLATYFFLLYFIGAYLRKYSGSLLKSRKFTGIASIVSILISILLTLGIYNQSTLYYYEDIVGTNGPIVLVSSIFIFAFFKNMNFTNKGINYIAGSMFGVYLVHENSFIRPIIWQKFISSKLIANNAFNYLTQAMWYSLLVFFVCIVIDILIRRLLLLKLINKLTAKISCWLNRCVEWFIN